MKKRLLLVCFLLTILAFPVASQDKSYEWLPGGTYDSKIPTPKQAFGYEIGDYLTDNFQMVAYIKELERISDRVKVFQNGETVERRKLWIVAVSI